MPHGHVEPGTGSWTQSLDGPLSLTKFSVNPADNNVYLISGPDSSVLIDAANDAPRIASFLGDHPVQTIVTTHRHPDHIQALSEIAAATGARLVCGEPDRDSIEAATGTSQEPVWTGSRIELPAGAHLDVVGAVGHTPGAIMLAYAPDEGPARIFAGDCLFPGGPGKTGNAHDFASLMSDLETKIFNVYPDSTIVHPGHGDDTTLGEERPHLAEWRARGW
ncbi:MBL fold metallo-hydrolase [Granulicoccus phenolivorans]|uniref:MBL fold metallo-hydrolase n=1 Tax=Granulicoccus phenolivorans TaxID=266854 RepID=UPI00041E685B|nr:MBL fold metallo-hydrolase [Granulicoccus phenolivorans]